MGGPKRHKNDAIMDIFEKEKLLEDDTKDFGSASYLRCILHTGQKSNFCPKNHFVGKLVKTLISIFRTLTFQYWSFFDPN